MDFYHVFSICGADRLRTVDAAAYGQSKLEEQTAEKLKLSKAEMTQYKALSGLVDAVIAGKEPAPADFKVAFHNHFIRFDHERVRPLCTGDWPGQVLVVSSGVLCPRERKGVTSAALSRCFHGHLFCQCEQLYEHGTRLGPAEPGAGTAAGRFRGDVCDCGSPAKKRANATEARRAHASVDRS